MVAAGENPHLDVVSFNRPADYTEQRQRLKITSIAGHALTRWYRWWWQRAWLLHGGEAAGVVAILLTSSGAEIIEQF